MASQAPSRQQCQDKFESGVAMTLHLWQPLSFAVETNLGGGNGADKRDWFAGAVAELYEDAWAQAPASTAASTASTAAASDLADDLLMDTESRLMQIMEDEFETIVDDGSAYDIATQIVALWSQCARGRFADYDALAQRWESSRGKSVRGAFRAGQAPDDGTAWETDDDDDDDDGEDDDDDDDRMDDAPALVNVQGARERAPPEVDEDGFTTVTRKKR